ncbi:hypothetical protein yaldo0001_38680 [Yersinia aldovae ATCC 35236]|nr:hypothetical protein yaldo0001_38680 [Yersinia aldovae ATCC 35236]
MGHGYVVYHLECCGLQHINGIADEFYYWFVVWLLYGPIPLLEKAGK